MPKLPKLSSTIPDRAAAPGLNTGPSALRARKQKVVRDVIWDAAIDLFAKDGFDKTTVDDIALAAGVSRRSFFRYFSSKSDLLAQDVVNYGTDLIAAIEACSPADSLSDVFRTTVLHAARRSAQGPRTREVMQIAAKYPEARAAQLSRVPEVQDRVAAAYARRFRTKSKDHDLKAQVLAGMTLSVLGVTFRFWFHGKQDVAVIAEQVFAAMGDLLCEGARR